MHADTIVSMNYWLVKADPDTDYSIDDLKRDGSTLWDGVHNFQAIGFIKQWEVGDHVYVYHSQKEKQIVGLAEVISEPRKNEDDPRTSWVADIKFVKKYIKTLSLADIKADSVNDEFLLVRNGRLSVMPVPDEVRHFIESRVA